MKILERLVEKLDGVVGVPERVINATTPRERLNIYGGIILGAIAPAALTYALLPEINAQSAAANLGYEAIRVVLSGVAGIGFLPISIPVGGAVGTACAQHLMSQRMEKEREEHQKRLEAVLGKECVDYLMSQRMNRDQN